MHVLTFLDCPKHREEHQVSGRNLKSGMGLVLVASSTMTLSSLYDLGKKPTHVLPHMVLEHN